ncbi:MAG: STAS-like domain-containing protein [Rikenellaceae bacterium]
MKHIKISKEFSQNLGGRFISLGDFSGEKFYNEILKPKFEEAKNEGVDLAIDLDGASPYGSSFLDESFGRLKREYGEESVKSIIKFETKNYPHVVELIEKRIW